MHSTRQLIIGILLGLTIIGLAATYYEGGLVRFYGDTTLTNLITGAVYYNTSNSTFWVGGISSNPVKIGDASWSNNVSGSVTNGLATTNYVHAQGFVTDGITNGLVSIVLFQAPTLTVLSNANLSITNELVIATVGTCTVTLPVVTMGRKIGIVKRDDGALLTINGGTVENDVNGARITTRFSAELVCDGTKWWIQ